MTKFNKRYPRAVLKHGKGMIWFHLLTHPGEIPSHTNRVIWSRNLPGLHSKATHAIKQQRIEPS